MSWRRSRCRVAVLLLGAHLRMLRARLWRHRRVERLALTAAGVLGLATWIAAYRWSVAWLEVTDVEPGQVATVLSGALATVATLALITGVGMALGSLYGAADVERLLAAPVPPGGLLLGRLAVQLASGSAIGVVFGGPWVLAYFTAAGHPWGALGLGIGVFGLAAVALAGGTALAVGVVRLVPAHLLRHLGGLVVTVTVVAGVATTLVLRGPEGVLGSAASLLDPVHGGGLADRIWLPTGWAAHSALAAARGDLGAAVGWLLPLCLGAAAAVAGMVRGCERAFAVGWERSRSAAGVGHRPAPSAIWPRCDVAVPVWWALALKDLRELRRDPAFLGQLLLPLALFAVYVASVATPGSHLEPAPGTRLPEWYQPALTAAFASLFAASGVALRGIGNEGRRFWVLRVAPIDIAPVLGAKLVVGTAVACGLALPLLWLGEVRSGASVGDMLAASGRLAVVVCGLGALATGIGGIRPRLDWTDPRRAVGLVTSLIYLTVGGAFIAACFVLLALPYSGGQAGTLRVAVADAEVVLLTLTVAVAALAAATVRLRVIEG